MRKKLPPHPILIYQTINRPLQKKTHIAHSSLAPIVLYFLNAEGDSARESRAGFSTLPVNTGLIAHWPNIIKATPSLLDFLSSSLV